MYSLIMLAALTPGADVTPAPVPIVVAPMATGCCGSIPVGCTGCTGCTGYVTSYGCSGSCSSCYGSCHGTFFHRGHGHRSSCFGNSGCFGCCGGACYAYGCGYGSGYGYSYGGGGSTWGPPIAMPPYVLHGYNQGGMYGYGPPVLYTDPTAVYGGVTINPSVTSGSDVIPNPMGTPIKPDATKAPTAPEPKPADPTKKTGTGMGANIKFKVPAAAKLFVDGKLTVLTGSERTFTTPPLAMGEKYYYEVKAELAVGGKVIVEEKRVIVEAGSNLTESFPTLVAAAEGKPTTVAGK